MPLIFCVTFFEQVNMISAFKKKKGNKQKDKGNRDSDRSRDSSSLSSETSSEDITQHVSKSPQGQHRFPQGQPPPYQHYEGLRYQIPAQNINNGQQFYPEIAYNPREYYRHYSADISEIGYRPPVVHIHGTECSNCGKQKLPQVIHGVQPQPCSQHHHPQQQQFYHSKPAREVVYTKQQYQAPHAHHIYTLHQQQMLNRRSFPNPMLSAYLGSG